MDAINSTLAPLEKDVSPQPPPHVPDSPLKSTDVAEEASVETSPPKEAPKAFEILGESHESAVVSPGKDLDQPTQEEFPEVPDSGTCVAFQLQNESSDTLGMQSALSALNLENETLHDTIKNLKKAAEFHEESCKKQHEIDANSLQEKINLIQQLEQKIKVLEQSASLPSQQEVYWKSEYNALSMQSATDILSLRAKVTQMLNDANECLKKNEDLHEEIAQLKEAYAKMKSENDVSTARNHELEKSLQTLVAAKEKREIARSNTSSLTDQINKLIAAREASLAEEKKATSEEKIARLSSVNVVLKRVGYDTETGDNDIQIIDPLISGTPASHIASSSTSAIMKQSAIR